jgi:hypothetical protein
MPFATWADFLCGHDGANVSNSGIADLGRLFEHGSTPLGNLKGEEATLFIGISPVGSPLFIHHLADLGSTQKDPKPSLVALAGLRTTTSIVRLTPADCFATIPSGSDDTAAEYYISSYVKLAASNSRAAFIATQSSTKHPLMLS